MPLFISPLPFLNVLIPLPRSDAENPQWKHLRGLDLLDHTRYSYFLPCNRRYQRYNHGHRRAGKRKYICRPSIWGARSKKRLAPMQVLSSGRWLDIITLSLTQYFLVSWWLWGKNGPFHQSSQLMSPAERARLRWRDNETREKVCVGGCDVTKNMTPGICEIMRRGGNFESKCMYFNVCDFSRDKWKIRM